MSVVTPRRATAALSRLPRRFCAGLLCGTLAIAPAWSQTAAPGQPTREEIERAPVEPVPDGRARLAIEGGVPAAPCALEDPRFADLRVTLSDVRFTGTGPVPAALLQESYAGEIGAERPISVLCAIRDRAAAILAQQGYLAAVEIPAQRLADGHAEFRVVLGRLTAVRVRGDAGPSERLIAQYLERLTTGEAFNRADAERALLLVGDLPGYDVRLSLRSAGGAPGELIGEVAVVRTPAVVTANIQNYGSRALGRYGGLLSAEIYGLTGLGDRTTFSVFSTLDFEEQQTVRVGHDFFVGGSGLAFGAQVTGSWGHPDVGLAGVDIDTDTFFATVQASYPLVRTRALTSRGTFGLDIVDQNVDFNDNALTRDRLRVLFARVGFDETDPASLAFADGYSPGEPRWRSDASFEVRQGIDIFDASSDCRAVPAACFGTGAVPTSRVGADPTGLLVRFTTAAELRPTPTIAFAFESRGQYSNDPLLAFEQFSAGNYTIGRGYDPGTLLGDRGLGASVEMRIGSLLPKTRDDVAAQPFVFFDTARVWNEGGGSDDLSSAGGGLRALWGDRVQADLSVAVPLTRTRFQDETGDVRVLFSLTTKLLPWRF